MIESAYLLEFVRRVIPIQNLGQQLLGKENKDTIWCALCTKNSTRIITWKHHNTIIIPVGPPPSSSSLSKVADLKFEALDRCKLLPSGNCHIMLADTRVFFINCTQNMHLVTAWNTYTLSMHAQTEKNPIIDNGYLLNPWEMWNEPWCRTVIDVLPHYKPVILSNPLTFVFMMQLPLLGDKTLPLMTSVCAFCFCWGFGWILDKFVSDLILKGFLLNDVSLLILSTFDKLWTFCIQNISNENDYPHHLHFFMLCATHACYAIVIKVLYSHFIVCLHRRFFMSHAHFGTR